MSRAKKRPARSFCLSPVQKTKKTSGAATRVRQVAREQLGFHTLRPGQREAIESVISGRDTLVVQPTGSGKSAIYQIAGLMLEGATVVVSPLIALQKDQVDSIGVQPHEAEAAVINSAQPAAKTREAVHKLRGGGLEYLFLAPEQLGKPETVDHLREAGISLFVIDEAHCITEWGHDFRPDYLRLGPVIEALDHPVVLAITATATSEVRDQIVERLGMVDPAVLVGGFDRPNLHLRVDRFQSESEKMEALIRRVTFADKPGIVYVATRKNAEAIMAALREKNIHSLFYHAGLKAKDRHEIQEKFMSGDAEVIVATNAFGMGVDKADVRFVYHFDISDSLDSYYQEAGRAGRDGEPAEVVLFYRPENLGVRKFQAGTGKLEEHKLEHVAKMVEEGAGADEIAAGTDMSKRKVISALNRLEEAGAVGKQSDGTLKLEIDPAEAARAAAGEHEKLKVARRERIAKMEAYAETTGCRREYLLRYFGEDYRGPCGNCDNDAAGNAGTRREVT